MPFHVNNLVGFGSGGRRSNITELQRGTLWIDTVDRTTYTSSSFSIGTASATRVVVALIMAKRLAVPLSLSSVTIGGVSATIHVSPSVGTTYTVISAIASAVVPTGTTAAVVATFSATCAGAAINTVAIDGLSSTTPYSTATDTDNFVSDTTTTDVAVIENSFLVSLCANGAGSGVTFTWTNATEWTESAADPAGSFGSAIGRPLSEQGVYTVTVVSQVQRISMSTVVFN